MKILLKIFALGFIPLSLSLSQEERNVLAEIFTNSHCTPCVSAHNTINDYLAASPNADRIAPIYYHMIYPYNDDPLYHHNPIDSDGRDDYYDPIPATPRGFFDGQAQGSVSTWTSALDNLAGMESPLRINLSGIKIEGSINIKAEVIKTGDIPDNDIVIHFVVVEDLNYQGRNGIEHHENVMRKMIDGAFGSPFSINISETKEEEREITLHPDWLMDSLKVVFFIQSDTNKTVYQSAIINYTELNDPTDTGNEINLPEGFRLEQNYPNPFNPSTKIKYQIAPSNLPKGEVFVSLKVYDILGNEIALLVNEEKQPGVYEVEFSAKGGSASGGDAYNLSSGIYYYKLQAGNFVQTKKMTLLK